VIVIRVVVRTPFKNCEIRWQDGNVAVGKSFIVERSLDGLIFATIATTTNLIHLDADLVPAVYWYRVRAVVNGVTSEPSNTVSVRMYSD